MIITGDCLDILPTLDAESVDSIVTDPPYGLSFMGKSWDHGVPGIPFWQAALLVAKPGAYLLAFGGTRTFHRLTCAIEDAGWEIRDCIMWVYGSGFPKSLDVSKAIDKAAGVKRERIADNPNARESHGKNPISMQSSQNSKEAGITAPATDFARQWQGWGTALKPAWEPIIVARKPLIGTVAENVLKYGTGAMNIDGCRVGDDAGWSYPNGRGGSGWHGRDSLAKNLTKPMTATQGRWPANLIHDGSEEVVGLFPVTGGESKPRTLRRLRPTTGWSGGSQQTENAGSVHCDSGSAARFFYCAKASRSDRNEGVDRNNHPTVKPTALMLYLCRLVTQPGGTILDPFCGSGSTGKAAEIGGFKFIGIDKDGNSTEISEERIAAVRLPLFQEAVP